MKPAVLSIQELWETVQSWLYIVLHSAFKALVYQHFLCLDECFPVASDTMKEPILAFLYMTTALGVNIINCNVVISTCTWAHGHYIPRCKVHMRWTTLDPGST